MGFVRSLEEEAMSPIEASYKPISDEVTHSPVKMDELYEALLGPAKQVKKIADLYDPSIAFGTDEGSPQRNNRAAYQYIARNIMTRTQYNTFMGGMDSAYFTERLDETLRDKLEQLSSGMEVMDVFG
jgi:hypothetical protein